MKKFIFLFFLLIIAGCAVLFFGWIRIPESHAGIFFSTITGYEEKLLKTGSLHWRWQRLIPGTSNLYLVNLDPRNASIYINEKLPSADTYSSIMPGNPSFSVTADISLTYRFTDQALLNFTLSGNLPEEGVESRYTDYNIMIESVLKSALTDVYSAVTMERLNSMLKPLSADSVKIAEIIEADISGIEIIELTTRSLQFPDLFLYASAKEQYSRLLQQRETLLLEKEYQSARLALELDQRLEALEKYGELLTKYPILLEYLKNNPESDILKDGIKLPLE